MKTKTYVDRFIFTKKEERKKKKKDFETVKGNTLLSPNLLQACLQIPHSSLFHSHLAREEPKYKVQCAAKEPECGQGGDGPQNERKVSVPAALGEHVLEVLGGDDGDEYSIAANPEQDQVRAEGLVGVLLFRFGVTGLFE